MTFLTGRWRVLGSDKGKMAPQWFLSNTLLTLGRLQLTLVLISDLFLKVSSLLFCLLTLILLSARKTNFFPHQLIQFDLLFVHTLFQKKHNFVLEHSVTNPLVIVLIWINWIIIMRVDLRVDRVEIILLRWTTSYTYVLYSCCCC